MVFGVLGNPQAGQGFDGFHGCAALGFGVDGAEKAPHIGLGGIEHAGKRSTQPQRVLGWVVKLSPRFLTEDFPMDLHTWLTFVAATCVIAISPGSGAVLSMSHGLSFGVRKASATIFGLQLGLLLILLVAGAGVGSLLLASEVAFNAVKVLGACYLIYVGFAQWRSASKSAAPSEIVSASGTSAAPAAVDAGSWQKRCTTGFLTNATNPKGIIFMVAVLPQFMSPERPLVDRFGGDAQLRGQRQRFAAFAVQPTCAARAEPRVWRLADGRGRGFVLCPARRTRRLISQKTIKFIAVTGC